MSLAREFYKDAQKEWDRLDIPLCRIEFASTLALIDEYMAGAAKIVADIGGGPGRYTIELLKRGCSVTLLDLSPENIALAQIKLAELGLCAEQALVGDARDLSALSGQSFDGVLALGPLYHLTARPERMAFLRTARALLNPGGVLIAAYLNAWGIARSLLTDAPTWYADSSNLTSLLNGDEFSGPRACSGFTECHWSNPERARTELHEAGFTVLEEVGAEGFASGARNEVAAIAKQDPALFEKVVEFGVLTSKLPQYRNATDHLLLVGRS
jgi:S-adenosylmethionine-dependent methyltransferase